MAQKSVDISLIHSPRQLHCMYITEMQIYFFFVRLNFLAPTFII